MTATVEETSVYTLAKDALEATDGDDALAFAQWKAWIIEDRELLNQALRAAWGDYCQQARKNARHDLLYNTLEKTKDARSKRSSQRQSSNAFGLIDVARQATESIFAWIIPYANVSLKAARRSDLAKAEDSLVKTINTQTWQCLFIRELRAGLTNELETVPDRFSESDIERMMERAHAAVYRRDKDADKAAD